MRPDGTEQTQLTSGVAFDEDSYAGAWSPDGEWLVFDRENAIFVIAKDGSGLRELVGAPAQSEGNYAPTFAPDGRRILFMEGRGAGRNERGLRIVHFDGSGLTDFPVGNFEPVSPDWR